MNDVDRLEAWLQNAGWTYSMTRITRHGEEIWLVDAKNSERRIEAEDTSLVKALTILQAYIMTLN